MTFLPAGFIDGARTSGEVLRRNTWIATRGATGVATASSLKVVALGTPGGAVIISAGGGVMATMFADAAGIQSYTVANDSAYNLPVPANGTGSAVTWQVIVRVRDPQYAGETTPADPLTNNYTVPELVSTVPTGRPYLWLATIVVPASTAAITNAMITDRRILASPRFQPEPMRVVNPSVNSDMYYNPYGNWPLASNLYQQIYRVPLWATMASVKITINGLYVVGPAPVFGGVRLVLPQIGTVTDHGIIYSESAPNRVGMSRGWNIVIPTARQGTDLEFDTQGQNTKGSPSQLRGDYQTQITWELTWLESL